MKGIIRVAGALAVLVAGTLAILSCGVSEGTVSLSLTDSPVLAADVAKAVITIKEIRYTRAEDTADDEDGWETLVSYDPAEPFDLLTLQGGAVEPLADVSLGAGRVGQIRFILDAPEASTGGGAPSTSGCYLELADTTRVPLFVPSGTQSGFKATGEFDVPVNGTVEITADFDVRKSIVRRGQAQDSYILKPTIRLVVNNQAGGIVATLQNADAYETLVLFAYANDTYDEAEAELPATETDDPQFSGAVTSAIQGGDESYRLAFLAAGTYDLVVAAYDTEGVFVEVVTTHEDVEVVSESNTQITIDLAPTP